MRLQYFNQIVSGVILLLILCFEWVVGLPLVFLYLFWVRFLAPFSYSQIVFFLLISIVLASLYGFNIIVLFVYLLLGKWLINSAMIRVGGWFGLASLAVYICAGFWMLGMDLTIRVALYAVLQLILVAVLHSGGLRSIKTAIIRKPL